MFSRRTFLGLLGGAATVAAAPKVLARQPSTGGVVSRAPTAFLIDERGPELFSPRGYASLLLRPGVPVHAGDFVQFDAEGFISKALVNGERRVGHIISANPDESGRIHAVVRFGDYDWDANGGSEES